MRTEHLKFPLHAEQTIRLPKGCKITGVTVENDITFLVIESPYSFPFSVVTANEYGRFTAHSEPLEMEDYNLRIYMEGEVQWSTDNEGNEVKTIIPVPEESDTLRKIATFKTVECAATWTVFEEVKA